MLFIAGQQLALDVLNCVLQTQKFCFKALLVLDTDGGRLVVKYNSLARKDWR